MRHLFLVSVFVLGSAALALGCSGDDSSTSDAGNGNDSGGGDSGGGNDSGGSDSGGGDSGTADSGTTDSGATDAGATDGGATDSGDGGAQIVNGCSSFTVKTKPNDTRQITFPGGQAPQQYSPPCLEIKAGQSVTWSGGFSSHPLEASGGDANSPIQVTNSGMSITFTFNTAGTFGFHCQFHPNVMLGAIHVIP